jgi:hypothetical protein
MPRILSHPDACTAHNVLDMQWLEPTECRLPSGTSTCPMLSSRVPHFGAPACYLQALISIKQSWQTSNCRVEPETLQ